MGRKGPQTNFVLIFQNMKTLTKGIPLVYTCINHQSCDLTRQSLAVPFDQAAAWYHAKLLPWVKGVSHSVTCSWLCCHVNSCWTCAAVTEAGPHTRRSEVVTCWSCWILQKSLVSHFPFSVFYRETDFLQISSVSHFPFSVFYSETDFLQISLVSHFPLSFFYRSFVLLFCLNPPLPPLSH